MGKTVLFFLSTESSARLWVSLIHYRASYNIQYCRWFIFSYHHLSLRLGKTACLEAPMVSILNKEVKLEHVIMHFDMEDTLLSLIHLPMSRVQTQSWFSCSKVKYRYLWCRVKAYKRDPASGDQKTKQNKL